MREETYRRISNRIEASETLMKAVIWTDRVATAVVCIAYSTLLIFLLIKNDAKPLSDGFVPALFIPGISFVFISIFRYIFDAPRPCEVFHIRPALDEKKTGRSFPSRHVFSAFIIATTVFFYNAAAGIFIAVAGTALALSRVLGGVHFVKDVVAGAFIGILLGFTGFWIVLPLFI